MSSSMILSAVSLYFVIALSVVGFCRTNHWKIGLISDRPAAAVFETFAKLCSFCVLNFAGCFCAFSDETSFEYIRNSLEVTLLSNLEQEDRLPFQGLPLVIVFAPEKSLNQKEIEGLREEGNALANSLQCPFIDVCNDPHGRFTENLVEEALRALIESIRHRSGLLNIYKSAPNNAEPDIR